VARKIQNAERGRANIARRVLSADFCNTIGQDQTGLPRCRPFLTRPARFERAVPNDDGPLRGE